MYTGCSLQALPSSLTLRITLKRVITASCLSALTMTANYTILTLQVATKLGNFCGPAWNINKIIILKRYNVQMCDLELSKLHDSHIAPTDWPSLPRTEVPEGIITLTLLGLLAIFWTLFYIVVNLAQLLIASSSLLSKLTIPHPVSSLNPYSLTILVICLIALLQPPSPYRDITAYTT